MSRRLLLLSPFAPRLDAPYGGGRVMAELARRLGSRHPTALVCLRGPDEPPVDEATRAACALVEEVPRPGPARTSMARWRRRARLAVGQARGRPMWATDWWVPEFAERARRVALTWAPDIIQVDCHIMAQYLPVLAGLSSRRVLVDYEPGAASAQAPGWLQGGYAGLVARLDVLAWARFERWALQSVDVAVAFTERDRRALAALAGNVPIVTIPFGTECPERALDPLGASPPTVLFVGTFLHPPNVDAALRLGGTLFPMLQAHCPEARLQIVGPSPPLEVQRLRSASVEVTGWVPDVVPYLDRASVVVAPVRRGLGMRVKVLEALAAGKALVASPLAVEGVHITSGQHCLVADSDAEFVDAMRRLLSNSDLRVALAGRARDWALANLGWDHAVAAFEDLYERLERQDEPAA